MRRRYLLVVSVILTIVIAIIKKPFDNGEGGMIYGFPVDILVYYGGWWNSYQMLGFLFNVAFYYLILTLILKLVKRLKK